MVTYRQATLEDVPWLAEAVMAAVEQRSDYGRTQPDWHQVLDDVENSQPDLDLSTDMSSPVVKALLAEARKAFRQLRYGTD
jgi:hypothetical protein